MKERRCTYVESVYAGASPDTLKEDALKYVWHQYTQVKEYAKCGPRMIVKGDGVRVWDVDGKEYLDFQAGMYTTCVGHGRAELAAVAAEQMQKLEYFPLFGYSNVPATLLAKKLAEITPGDLTVTCYGVSGSEAVEIALKIARQYQTQRGFTKRYKVIARRRSYHGVTFGALSANGIVGLRTPYEPLVPGFRHIPQPDCYRCEFGKTYPGCDIECAKALEQQILFEGPETVAAFIAEPVAVADCTVVPVREYWPKIREICTKYGVLMIVDEVICAFGRTGKMFASEHWSVSPDIMTFAKQVTSGYLPLGGAVVTPDVARAFEGDYSRAFQHGGTYSGHPTSCAVALKNIEIIEREGLVKNAEEVGKYCLEKLQALRDFPVVGNVTGLGLLLGIELVKDRDTKEWLPKAAGDFFWQRCYELGLITRYRAKGPALSPPLVVTKEQVDRAVEILYRVAGETNERFT